MPMGAWVLHSALRQLRAWLDAGLQPLTLAVNLSGVQFNQPELPAQVAQWLHASGVPPDCLELELTEAVALKNPQQAIEQMQALSQLGVRLAIDDFGTGYASLSYLQEFPFDFIKVDKSFVDNITTQPTQQHIVKAIKTLGNALNMQIVAEGIETREQQQVLTSIGCEYGQGYLFGKPMTAAQATDLLKLQAAKLPRDQNQGVK